MLVKRLTHFDCIVYRVQVSLYREENCWRWGTEKGTLPPIAGGRVMMLFEIEIVTKICPNHCRPAKFVAGLRGRLEQAVVPLAVAAAQQFDVGASIVVAR